MNVVITDQPFDPWQQIQTLQIGGLKGGAADFGATAVFVGTLRDFNEGDAVEGMFLEHYPGMTERYLEKISAEAADRWQLVDTLIVHRVGELRPADPIVLVAVWSAHRKAAFDASRWLMEALKSHAPFWKKEQLKEGSRWVEHNTPG
ncbi:molybdopterin synthase subunit MoaE [Thiogranum longum]|uniref:Molybdopterin synthase catalytic subunit n=1 Tax=Thiogranum longum TaxID=1537524 RepID=A0A4R1HBQ3_9GAMM|nr:molybdenum cofactor biosynthesis protein MoaE [Thiogranum longum]TCK19424.1 molybdopterin synthase subunit MoaE [Thiogranum longum]